MKRVRLAAALLAITFSVSVKQTVAADTTDFSGKYVINQTKKAQNGSAQSTLQVLQNENAIEVTLAQSGKSTTSHCPFGGSEGDYTSPGGVLGKCKAEVKGKTLILDSVVVTHPRQNSNVRVHAKERWQLSRDGKTLTIKTDIDFPDFPFGISAAVSGDTPTTTKYTRVDTP
ncbi:MAG TPA: hypothetical protein VGS78_08160 [Candidatus Sulfotelmatobacter sp.]|nr:hypothetical protein [Candidatus Sulfotelmatobacter sp.]